MVELLVQWVTQIIIFIILATIIDLLVPANSMKKYIKFVVGLVLILIFLKPFFYLFDFNIEQTLDRSFNEIFATNDTKNIENLVEMQKSEIESSQNAYILEQMAVQLKDIANTPLKEEHKVEITAINFSFKIEQAFDFENLEEVIVTIRESEEGEGTIQAVDDVVINTEDPLANNSDVDSESIKEFLQEIWDLHDKKLSILWEGGAS
ncbi:stage III sporulation protein AF [Ornithinibacillus halophilus]|uniref:Stage III sporulation protein AF n=1 Tax=Ornithinibacillus halophilus TaxID=930117 RepID=A0A1M5CYV6_9BACI|nr:stage III sporulation protein AF [Ornithinibacillus halophilus]